MTNHISIKGRSRIMRAIRSKNTKPELFVRKLLFSNGYRYRLHRADLPGNPDIVFIGRRKVIFVHGCFWHQHDDPKCRISQKPQSNKDYWLPKLERNRKRDQDAQEKLKNMGWSVLVLWECQICSKVSIIKRLKAFLDS